MTTHTLTLSYTPARQIAVLIIAITGGATWLLLSNFADFPRLLGLWPMIRLTTACAFVGGLMAAPLFGRPGLTGIFVALFGAVLATCIGALLAVALVEGAQAAIFGPIFVMSALVTEPACGGAWVLLMLLAHATAEEGG